MTKDILNKVKDGDPINDAELKIAIKFYSDLESSLQLLGERYHFAWLDCFHILHRLNGFKKAREERVERDIKLIQ